MFAVLGHGSRRLRNDDCVWLCKLRVLVGGRAGYAPTNDRALKLTRFTVAKDSESELYQQPDVAGATDSIQSYEKDDQIR